MAKYVFCSLPTYGSVNPTLAVVHELVNRGHEVVYYVPKRFAHAAQEAGAVVRDYESRTETAEIWAHAKRGGMPALMVEEARHVVPQLLDRVAAEDADCMVYATVYVPARIVSQVLGLPAVALRPTYAANEQADWFATMVRERTKQYPNMPEILAQVSRDLAELCATYRVPPFDVRGMTMHAERLNVVFLPRAFQLAGDTFDDRYLFVGPSIRPRSGAEGFALDRLDGDQPILYISLGTILNKRPDFFRTCFEAFGGQPWRVVLSSGTRVEPSELGPVPDNFELSSYVPQLEVLARARGFVTHCGMNSTMESLYFGVPMVGVPQAPEQAITAGRLVDLDLGIALERTQEMDPVALRAAAERVMTEPVFHERAGVMRAAVRDAGGYQRAADAMIRFVTEQAPAAVERR